MPFRISNKHRVVIMPYDARIAQIIPHAKRAEKYGRQFLFVPHRDTETKLLNNTGYAVPAPILSQYDWAGTTPFESQKDTARLLTQYYRAYVLNDMGTGKTRASLYACDYLMASKSIKRVLVIAPLSTLSTVWVREIFSYFPHRLSIVLHGTKKKRLLMLQEAADFYIINHDGVGVIKDALAKRQDIDAVIIDELALLRNARTKRWKAINDVVKTRKYAWGMTGSPIPKAPTDAYGQVKLLTPETAPKFFTEFRARTMHQVTQFKWVPRKDANDVVYGLMQPSVRYNREDCIDLPPTMYTTLECAMTPDQQQAYDKMYQEFVVETAMTKLGAAPITAVNSGVQFGKLIQIGGGFIYGEHSAGIRFAAEFDDTPRYKLLTEVIDETTHKVIVFAPYIHLVDTLAQRLTDDGYSVEKIHGGTKKAARDTTFHKFQLTPRPRVLVAHPQTMSHGLTLTAANTIVWYLPVFDLETYEQANARITRPSQKSRTHIVHIQATPVEKRVYETLRKRGDTQKALLGLFRGQ